MALDFSPKLADATKTLENLETHYTTKDRAIYLKSTGTAKSWDHFAGIDYSR